jgi:iron only hydrogenase large subunit-like protein
MFAVRLLNIVNRIYIPGCITSAETVLIEQQSAEQIYKVFAEKKSSPEQNRPYIVFSLALQPIVSLRKEI